MSHKTCSWRGKRKGPVEFSNSEVLWDALRSYCMPLPVEHVLYVTVGFVALRSGSVGRAPQAPRRVMYRTCSPLHGDVNTSHICFARPVAACSIRVGFMANSLVTSQPKHSQLLVARTDAAER